MHSLPHFMHCNINYVIKVTLTHYSVDWIAEHVQGHVLWDKLLDSHHRRNEPNDLNFKRSLSSPGASVGGARKYRMRMTNATKFKLPSFIHHILPMVLWYSAIKI